MANKPGWISSSIVKGIHAGQKRAAAGEPAFAASPGYVPPPPVTPQPFDPAFEAAKLGATWNTQVAQGEAGYQKGETAWGLGYNADGSINTANPYSQAMMLQGEYKRSQQGSDNSLTGQGLYFSGARLNAQATNDRSYAQGSSSLRDQARQSYHGIDYGQLQSYGQNALGVSGADYEALRKAVYG